MFGAKPYLAVTPFRLSVNFESEPPEAIRSEIRSQLERILAPTGWTIEWDTWKNAGKVSVRLAAVTFKGACNVDDLTTYMPPPRKLGRTHVSNGMVLSFADVYCDNIRASIAAHLVLMDPTQRELCYGRAVGRVLAHEIYHMLTREKDHGSQGVAQASFSPEELIADDFQFHPNQVRELRLKLIPVLLGAYQWPDSAGGGAPRGARLFLSSGCGGCHGLLGEGTRWAPTLRATGLPLSARELRDMLDRTDSKMYRRAQKMGMVWPSLPTNAVDELVRYLNNIQEWILASRE